MGSELRAVLIVFFAALAVRIVHVWSFAANAFPFFDSPNLDAAFYDAWARRIADGALIGERVFDGVPLYPYLLALVYRTLGDGAVTVALVQAVVGALGVVALHTFCRRAFSPAVAHLAAAFAALHPPTLVYESLRLVDGLATAAASLLLLLAYELVKAPTARRAIATGVVLGLAVLARERFLLFAPLLAALVVFEHRATLAHGLRAAALLAVGVCLPLTASLAHNLAAADDAVLLSSAGGVNFWAGNRAEAHGWFELPAELAQSRSDMYAHSQRIAERELGRELAASEVSSFFAARGTAFWRDEPGAATALFVRKLLLFWNGLEFTDVVDLAQARDHSAILWNPLASFRVVAPLALVGLVVAWRLQRRDPRALRVLIALLLANVLFMALFFVSSRFRVSALPSVYPFAAAAIVWAFERWRSRAREPLALAAVGLAVAAVFVNMPPAGAAAPNPAVGAFNLGAVHYREARYAQAEPHFRAAVQLDPNFAKAWYHLASSLKLTGRLSESEPLFERAFALDPSDARGLTFYAALLLDTNRPALALTHLERALAIDPALGIAAVGQGVAHERLGNITRAIECYRHAAAIDPGRAADVAKRLARLGVR